MTLQHGVKAVPCDGARILSCLENLSSLEVTPGSLFSPFRNHQTFQPFCSDARVLSWEEWCRPQYCRVSHVLVPLWRRALLLALGMQGQSERFKIEVFIKSVSKYLLPADFRWL